MANSFSGNEINPGCALIGLGVLLCLSERPARRDGSSAA